MVAEPEQVSVTLYIPEDLGRSLSRLAHSQQEGLPVNEVAADLLAEAVDREAQVDPREETVIEHDRTWLTVLLPTQVERRVAKLARSEGHVTFNEFASRLLSDAVHRAEVDLNSSSEL